MPRGRASNYVGMVFGRLTIIALSDRDSRHGRYWRCRCECGRERDVRGDNLSNGKTVSCGCYLKDVQQGMVNGKRAGRRVAKKRRGAKKKRRRSAENIERRFDEDPRYQAMGDF